MWLRLCELLTSTCPTLLTTGTHATLNSLPVADAWLNRSSCCKLGTTRVYRGDTEGAAD